MADPAAARFFAMQLARMAGVAVAVYGLLAAAADIPWPDGLPRWLGFVLLVAGMAEALLVPRMMARAWNSEALARRSSQARNSSVSRNSSDDRLLP